MANSTKNSRVGHAPCSMLSKEANDKFFSILEPKTRALSTGFVSVVLSRPPKHPDWKWYRTGLATLVKDHNRKSYYVQIYDIIDWEKTKEEELSKGKVYQVSLPNFHQMETAKGHAMGLKFSSENEAKAFAQIARAISMTGHYKSEGSPSPMNSSDEDTLDQVDEDQVLPAPLSSDNDSSLTQATPPPPEKDSSLTPANPPPPEKDSSLTPPTPPPPEKDSSLTSATPPPPENEDTFEIKSPEKDLSLAPPPPPPVSRDPPSSSPLSPLGKDPPFMPPRPPPPANKDGAPQRPMQPKSSMKALSPPPPPPPVKKNVMLPPAPPPPKAPSIKIQSPPPTPTNRNAVASPIQKEFQRIKSPPPTPPTPTSPPNSGATLDKRKIKSKKITKNMIGIPTNFHHVSHIGFNTEVTLDDKTVQSIMCEPVKRPNAPPPPPPNRRSSVQFPLSHAPAQKRFPEENVIVSFDEDPKENDHARKTVQESTMTDTAEDPKLQDNQELKQPSDTEGSIEAKNLLGTQLVIKRRSWTSPDLLAEESTQLQPISEPLSSTDGIYSNTEPEHNNNKVKYSSKLDDNYDTDNQKADNSTITQDSLNTQDPDQLLANRNEENVSSSLHPQSGQDLQDGKASPNALPTPRLNESFDFSTEVIKSLNELDIMLEGASNQYNDNEVLPSEVQTHDEKTSQLELAESESKESDHPPRTLEKQTNMDNPEDSFTGDDSS